MSSHLDKALVTLQGVGSHDPERATQYLSQTAYCEHNPLVADGVAGAQDYVRQLAPEECLQVIRIFEDGPFVFAQSDGQMDGDHTFFDVFRFESDSIVEHWRFRAKAGPPNQSGHTQVDGPTEAKDLEASERNKSFLREYYENFHIMGDHGRHGEYFVEGKMARHEPGVKDGVQEFLRDVQVLMQHRTIDRIGLLLGQGDFLFLVAEGTHESKPCLYIDLYRVENLKVGEHWGFPQSMVSAAESRNANGML